MQASGLTPQEDPVPRENGRRKRQTLFTGFVLTIKRMALDEMTFAGAQQAR